MTATFLQDLHHPIFETNRITVQVFRLDLKHARYSGNKDYKLRYLRYSNKQTIVSFGGAWSNHLLALSRFGADKSITTIAYVRSYDQHMTPLLAQCVSNGMRIIWCSPESYRLRNDPSWLADIQSKHDNALILSEGGVSEAALLGCTDIGKELAEMCPNLSHAVLAVGTGQTMAGVCLGLAGTGVKVEGEATTKQFFQQQALIQQTLETHHVSCSWQLSHHPDLGRYGQLKPVVIDFVHWFERCFDIPLDPNYTAKAFYAFFKRLEQRHYPSGAHVVLIHTGGLMGRQGYAALSSAV